MPVDPRTLTLIIHPCDVLRQKADPVDPSDSEVQTVTRRLMELMVQHEGAGLAAPQVGLPWRIFVTRNPENMEEATAWINPTLEIVSPELVTEEEGCLSLPHVLGNVRRPLGIKITGWNMDGEPSQMTSEDYLARVWQHEYDHLEGILIIDKMSAMDRLVNRRAIRTLELAV